MEADRLRLLLLAVFVLGSLGTTTELLLLEHFETWRQWLPLALLGFGIVAAAGLALRPARAAVLGLRGLAIAFVLSGALGVWFHLEANVEFEREIDAAIGGTELAWESLTGALPALAPGSMVLLGLIALVITAGHPACENSWNRTTSSRGETE